MMGRCAPSGVPTDPLSCGVIDKIIALALAAHGLDRPGGASDPGGSSTDGEWADGDLDPDGDPDGSDLDGSDLDGSDTGDAGHDASAPDRGHGPRRAGRAGRPATAPAPGPGPGNSPRKPNKR
jgi:hypothetical protein